MFDGPYMGIFKLKVRIKEGLKKFFEGVRIDNFLEVEVNPAYLAIAENKKDYLN